MSELTGDEKNFNFRLYTYMLQGVTPSLLFVELSEEIWLVPQRDVQIGVYFLLAVIAPILLPLKLESGESMPSYSPHQILRQFGYNQRAVWILGECLGSPIALHER